MRRLFLFTALLLLLPGAALAAAGNGFELRCEREMKPVLSVHLHETAFTVYNNVSSRMLHTRESHGEAAQMMLGMTSGSARSEIVFDAPGLLDHGAGRECIAPHVSIDLSYDPLRVYIAREFNKYSCSYRVIYEHEMRHIALYRTELPKVEQALRAALEQRYAGPVYAPAGTGLSRLAADVDDWLRPLVRAELAHVVTLQEAIDSPEEEFRLKLACGGEVATTLGDLY